MVVLSKGQGDDLGSNGDHCQVRGATQQTAPRRWRTKIVGLSPWNPDPGVAEVLLRRSIARAHHILLSGTAAMSLSNSWRPKQQ